MATVLSSSLARGGNSLPSSPAISSSYTDLLKDTLQYQEDVDSKQNFMHAEYNQSFAPSIPSTAPSSPLYTQSMGSRGSFFSTPTYSALDPNEEFSCDEDDSFFPLFENNAPQAHTENKQFIQTLEDTASGSSTPINTPSEDTEKRRKKEQRTKDDSWIVYEPTRHVDYLSHDWKEHEVWSSWRYVVARRKEYGAVNRFENASWRTWIKTKNDLKTISPESLNWMKDCDVTWLYGPLQIDTKNDLTNDRSPPPSRLSTCSSFLSKKPILKKRSTSALLLEHSQKQHTLLKRVGDIIRVQQSSPRPSLRRGGSDFSLPSYHTSSVLNSPAEADSRSEHLPRSSFGSQTPSEPKHVFFNEEVRQVRAIDSEDEEKDGPLEDDLSDESDEDDDGGLMMAPARMRSNRSTPRSSFSENNKTIAPLPSTTLKYRKDTPEPPETLHANGNPWTPVRRLQHSSSQETLKPSRPNHNFLLDDDPELNDEPWISQPQNDGYSPYEQEEHEEPYGMRRTASGMFMPYDEHEEEAAMNDTLFGQAMYAVNTFRDIAHVVWNVGWNRGR